MRAPKIPLQDRVFVNQCGVDNVTFSPKHKDLAARARISARLGLPSNARLLLYAGGISPEKNVKLLMDLMRELRTDEQQQFHLAIAGDGPALGDLRKQARLKTPGVITFLGHITDKFELASLYANADAFVHTNPNEPFGIAPLEALASGLPLVAPNAGGVVSYA